MAAPARTINVAFISRSFYFSHLQPPPPSSSSHTIHVFLVPVLLDFLELKYQGQDTSAFQTHRKTMIVAVSSFLLHCLALARIIGHGKTLFGWLSSVSLASVLVPDWIRPVLFLVFVLFSAGELRKCWIVQMVWYWLRRRVRGNIVHGGRTGIGRALIGSSWFVAPNYTTRRAILPV